MQTGNPNVRVYEPATDAEMKRPKVEKEEKTDNPNVSVYEPITDSEIEQAREDFNEPAVLNKIETVLRRRRDEKARVDLIKQKSSKNTSAEYQAFAASLKSGRVED